MQKPKFELTKKKSEKSIVGLEIEAGSIAAAEVKLNGEMALTATAVAPLPEGAFEDGEVVDQEAVAAALTRLFEDHKLARRVRLGIANQRVVVRTMRLPAIDDPSDLEAAVRFEAEERIPMPIDQAVLDYRVIGAAPTTEEEAPKIDVVVVAARRDMITASLRPLREAGLEPVGVDLSAFGLIRALGSGTAYVTEHEGGPPPTLVHCHLGDGINLAVAKGRSCLFTRVAPGGVERIAEGLATSAGMSVEHARQWLTYVGLVQPIEAIEGDRAFVTGVRHTLESGVDGLLDEIRLSLDFYAAQEDAATVTQLVLSGPGAVIPGIAERMAPSLTVPVTIGTPPPLAAMDAASAARLTLPYGIALDG